MRDKLAKGANFGSMDKICQIRGHLFRHMAFQIACISNKTYEWDCSTTYWTLVAVQQVFDLFLCKRNSENELLSVFQRPLGVSYLLLWHSIPQLTLVFNNLTKKLQSMRKILLITMTKFFDRLFWEQVCKNHALWNNFCHPWSFVPESIPRTTFSAIA